MKIRVNGKVETIAPCSIAEFVMTKGLPVESLVVEYNREIVKQAQWTQVSLKEDDQLELLSFVGGG
ncbi:MAG: sulfur carrier protein [Desulforhopalus sp.]|jgi:sulfur carrier protein